MKKAGFCAVLLSAVMLLSGCSVFDGQYVRVTPHEIQSAQSQQESTAVRSYVELRETLTEMVAAGRESMVILTQDYPETLLEENMKSARRYVCGYDPIGAYAVEDMTYEIGAKGGMTAVAVTVSYRHSQSDIRGIVRLANSEQLEQTILTALEEIEFRQVILVEDYTKTDFGQMVQNLAQANPRNIMECPQVSVDVYGQGAARLIELSFTYENGRDVLRQMRQQVSKVFDSASLYVSGDGSDRQKLNQLYSFLMDRFSYTMDTSITPAYSLLRHGVGDSRAFAMVFAAMCRDAGLECLMVTGTKNAEPWTWNIVQDAGQYYHLDLTQCKEDGFFHERTDDAMGGYVWDYSAFPACGTAAREISEEP